MVDQMMGKKNERLIEIQDLQAWYGESHILHGVSFEVNRGELITLLGRNGAGRTSVLKAILGLMDDRRGAVRIKGVETLKMAPHQIAKLGIGYCPEERGIFSSLTTEENLLLPPMVGDAGLSLDEVYEMFPNLYERRKSQGSLLSGGEQQMLALARTLRAGGDILLLDEITEGLAPTLVQLLGKSVSALKSRGYTMILVEQNFRFAATLADRHYVVERGEVVEVVKKGELEEKTGVLHQYLGV